MASVLVDANLLLLLVVGSAQRGLISSHKRLSGFSEDDFDLLESIISEYSELVVTAHTLTEVSSLARQIGNPARQVIQAAVRRLIETALELPVPSRRGAVRNEFGRLGLTDAIILDVCSPKMDGVQITLLTSDVHLPTLPFRSVAT